MDTKQPDSSNTRPPSRLGVPTAVTATLEILAIISMIAASVLVVRAVALRPRPATVGAEDLALPSEPVSIAGAPWKGSATAPVVMVIYSDFECPYCKRFAQESLPEINKLYVETGKLRLVFRDLPLTDMHKEARNVAVAGRCAFAQNQFWQWHDVMFSMAAPVTAGAARMSAAQIPAMDVARFELCVSSKEAALEVESEIKAAGDLGIRGTPSFMIGRSSQGDRVVAAQFFAGLRPMANLKSVLDMVIGSR